jgi:hypothetical protein
MVLFLCSKQKKGNAADGEGPRIVKAKTISL